MCARLRWKVFLLRRSPSAPILATRLIWMGAYCILEGPVKLLKETFHSYPDSRQIFTHSAMEKFWAWIDFLVKALHNNSFLLKQTGKIGNFWQLYLYYE